MKHKKTLLIVLCFLLLAIVAGVVCVWMLKVKELKNPQVVSDICYNKNKYFDGIIYVTENGTPEPYYVIQTDNYGADAVLLMRKNAYPEQMQYREEKMFGVGGAYYSGCIVDEFLENEFYNSFSEGMKGAIRNTTVRIHSIHYVSKRFSEGPTFEDIERHVFILSLPEHGWGSLGDSTVHEAELIPELKELGISKYTWLRSEEIGGDDTWAGRAYEDAFSSQHISNESYVRPVFTVDANEKIEIRTIESEHNKKIFVFSRDKNCRITVDKSLTICGRFFPLMGISFEKRISKEVYPYDTREKII